MNCNICLGTFFFYLHSLNHRAVFFRSFSSKAIILKVQNKILIEKNIKNRKRKNDIRKGKAEDSRNAKISIMVVSFGKWHGGLIFLFDRKMLSKVK